MIANAADIDVVNMSLGGGNSPALKSAITNSTINDGIIYVVAAGNENSDTANVSPANAPGAITVSAIADFDGIGGGAGGSPASICNDEADDSFATFSNHGAEVDIAAPGVCVVSFWGDDEVGLYYSSGTSMATPHVTGVVALIIDELRKSGASTDVAAVKAELFARATPQADPDGYDFANDDDNIREPLLSFGATIQRPTVSITSPVGGDIVSGTVMVKANVTGGLAIISVEFKIDGTTIDTDFSGGDGWAVNWNTITGLDDGSHVLTATATDSIGTTGSGTVTVIVDNIDDAPIVTITSPGNDDTVNGVVTITADASDDNAGVSVEFFVDGASIGGSYDGDVWTAIWNTAGLQEVRYNISAVATDNASKTDQDDITVTVGAVSTSLMEVAGISFSQKGRGLTAKVKIAQTPGGASIADALVEVSFCSPSDCYFIDQAQTTNGKGEASFKVIGINTAEVRVTKVTHGSYEWDGADDLYVYP